MNSIDRPIEILQYVSDSTLRKDIEAEIELTGIRCVVHQESASEAFERALADGPCDLIVAEWRPENRPQERPHELAGKLRPDAPLIYVGGRPGEEVVVEALQQGACDFVFRDRLSRLGPAIHRAAEIVEERRSMPPPDADAGQLRGALLQARQDLGAARKEVHLVSYAISHDLRAPVRHVTGFAKMLLDCPSVQQDNEACQITDRLVRAAEWIDEMIQSMLAFSRLARSPIEKAPVSLDEVLGKLVGEFQDRIEDRSIEWRIGSLPVVQGDLAMIRQLFTSLIDNAVKFTRHQKHAVIEIDATEREREWVVRVKDNGVGFNMKFAQNLFGLFQRLHSINDFPGAGVGLAAAQRIIHRHDGRLWAEARPNAGATFFVSFPRNSDAAPDLTRPE